MLDPVADLPVNYLAIRVLRPYFFRKSTDELEEGQNN